MLEQNIHKDSSSSSKLEKHWIFVQFGPNLLRCSLIKFQHFKTKAKAAGRIGGELDPFMCGLNFLILVRAETLKQIRL